MLPLDDGSYDAFCSGNTTKFTIERHNYIAEFDTFVKGINVSDVVEVMHHGRKITSKLLGENCISVKVLL